MTREPGQPETAPERGSASVDELHTDWPWLRPTLTFMLGLLVGTILMASSRPPADAASNRPITNAVSTTCDQVSSDSEQLANLAIQARDAAQDHSTGRLADLRQALADSQNHLAADLATCPP